MKCITLKIGIISKEEYQQRTLDIAKGLYKKDSKEPKVWLTSLDSLAKLLSPKNKALLDLIRESHPQSIQEISDLTGRDKGNISKTLKLMSHYGIISLKKKEKGAVVPEVKFNRIQIEYEFDGYRAA